MTAGTTGTELHFSVISVEFLVEFVVQKGRALRDRLATPCAKSLSRLLRSGFWAAFVASGSRPSHAKLLHYALK
jgi:hypothetical protein